MYTGLLFFLMLEFTGDIQILKVSTDIHFYNTVPFYTLVQGDEVIAKSSLRLQFEPIIASVSKQLLSQQEKFKKDPKAYQASSTNMFAPIGIQALRLGR